MTDKEAQMRKAAIRTEAVQVLRSLAASLRAEAKGKTDQARAIEALLKAQGQVKTVQKAANLSVNGHRPTIPAAIRRELERAATDDLEKRMARIKVVPITSVERVLSRRKE